MNKSLGITLAVLTLASATGCAGTAGTAKPTTAKTVTVTADPDGGSDDTTVDEPTPDKPERYRPKKRDFQLKVRTTSKQCFGSAGCSVEYKVTLGWAIPDPGKLAGTYDVGYRVTGDESGPILDTITIYPNGRYDVPYENSISTPSTNTPIKARVTSVVKSY